MRKIKIRGESKQKLIKEKKEAFNLHLIYVVINLFVTNINTKFKKIKQIKSNRYMILIYHFIESLSMIIEYEMILNYLNIVF